MDSPRGRILSIRDDASARCAVVEVAASITCARCAAGKGCGAGLPGSNGGPRRVDAQIAAGLDLHEGDEVRISLAPESLLRAALIVYGLPLVGATGGAAAAYFAGAGDPGAALAALAGASLGIASGRRRLRKRDCLRRFTPTIVARLAAAGD